MRAAVALLALLAFAATAWLVFSGGKPPPDARPDTPPAANPLPEPGRLAAPAADSPKVEREDAPRAVASASDAADAETPLHGWFRGQLRILSGELPTPPMLAARLSLASDGPTELVPLRVDPRSLEFEAAARHPLTECRIEFPKVIRPVRATGGTIEEGRIVRFAAPDQFLLIEVEVDPHVGVLFLHGTTSEPLAGAFAGFQVQAGESSASTGDTLGPDGLMLVDFDRLHALSGAEAITFMVTRPPDVGFSQSRAFPIEEFLLHPRPVVLHFSPTERLHFRALDPNRRPIAGVRIRLGPEIEDAGTDAEGRIAVLQSAPPVTTVKAEASGFLTEDFPIDGPAAAEQELILTPASRLVLTVAELPPGGESELSVEILFDGRADGSTLSPERFHPGRIVEQSGGIKIARNPKTMRSEMSTHFSKEGRVVLDGIFADVPAQVLVQYRGFTVLDERVPFAPGDGDHTLQVGTLPELVPLRGRVTDAGGTPIAGATVRLFSNGFPVGAEAICDAAGEFLLGELPVDGQVRLRVSAAGFAPRVVDYLGAHDDPDSVGTVILNAGYALVVQVLGPDGAPFDPADVTAWQPRLEVFGHRVGPASAPPQPLGPAEYWFADLPGGSLPFSLSRSFQEWGGVHVVEGAAGRATITLTPEEASWLGAPK